jgi:DNA-binding IclR family transcriptional regulator
MTSNTVAPLAPLHDEALMVLSVLADDAPTSGLKLNDLTALTGLPTGHVGRHLRSLEADRLAAYGAGAWHVSRRGLQRLAIRAAAALAA